MRTAAVFIVGLFCMNSDAYPFWGSQKSFEECLAAEMKGRDRSQLGITKNACRKKFPAIPSFTKTSKTGTLYCHRTSESGLGRHPSGFEFKLEVTKKSIGNFTIKRRTKEYIVAENPDLPVFSGSDKGSEIGVNFEWGTGSVVNLIDRTEAWYFECAE
jgi:hypothetical protein